jgi:hypothetical protein
MSMLRAHHAGGLMLASALLGCSGGAGTVAPPARDTGAGTPAFTLGSGSTSTLLGRAPFTDPHDRNFKVKRTAPHWNFEIKANPGFDVAVQSILFQPGSQSGWHSHPGPVLIQVVSGTMTFYESDDPSCTPIVRTAGEGYLDTGDHAHIARNETHTAAQNIVTYFAPPGAALRIDEPSPGNCPF